MYLYRVIYRRMRNLFIILALITSLPLFSQFKRESEMDLSHAMGMTAPRHSKVDTAFVPSWRYGLNIGFYFANQKSAGFYSGKEGNENEISFILANKYRYDEIRQLLKADTFILRELPARMSYDPALMVGFLAKYQFDRHLGFIFQFNYVKLKATDFFTLEVDPMPFLTQPDIRLYGIVGEEERVNVELGLTAQYPIGNKINYFVEAGLNINDSEARENKIQIEGMEYDIVNIYGSQNYVPNTSLQTYDIRQGGIGFGIFLNTGVQFIFNENLSLDPSVSLWWKQINLAGYNAYTPHFSINVRFLFKDLL